MAKVIVIEPVRVPNSRGTGYVTISPEYRVDGNRKLKICPVIELDARRASILSQAGHLQKTKSKAETVTLELNGKIFSEVQPVEQEPKQAGDPGEEEKEK